MIIVIRHAQSEGNENRAIHQTTPDHRVKLTPHGWTQAAEAGHRLRALLKPDDTLHFFTSPYRRTRETTEGILRSLTADTEEQGPSPFPRNSIKVWEEPRLREQDFGNFQPCSAQMERMWQERADYGHFFYRIPNGESAADAYDRISGFNETLWRSFGEDDFASVCVLVTHGLMSRVFLMKWYHWSVEYFEDLRNVNHCEFILMKRQEENGKYMLQNNLRTWSELRRQKALEAAEQGLPVPSSASASKAPSGVATPAFQPNRKQWGGCPEGCTHEHDPLPRRPRRQTTKDSNGIHSSIATEPAPVGSDFNAAAASIAIVTSTNRPAFEEDDEAFPRPTLSTATTSTSVSAPSPMPSPTPSSGPEPPHQPSRPHPPQTNGGGPQSTTQGKPDLTALGFSERLRLATEARPRPSYLEAGRDFGGSRSGATTPALAYVDDTPHGPPSAAAGDYGFPATAAVTSPARSAYARPAVGSRLSREVGEAETEKIWPRHVRQDELDDAREDAAAEEEEDKEAVREEERRDRSLRGSVY